MGDYSCKEIGMLVGAVIGGLLAVLGFLATGKLLFLISAFIGAFAGTAAGMLLERNKSVKHK